MLRGAKCSKIEVEAPKVEVIRYSCVVRETIPEIAYFDLYWDSFTLTFNP